MLKHEIIANIRIMFDCSAETADAIATELWLDAAITEESESIDESTEFDVPPLFEEFALWLQGHHAEIACEELS